jgi:phosphate:Na+ symporter
MTIFNLISLVGGLALFLYGMRRMSDGLRRGSSGALKKAMEKVTNNPLVGFLLGLTVTAVIQSSTATIVITSGLVAAGILSLHQSLGIIIGANVGTTVTGQIIRLLDISAGATSWLNVFKPSTLAPIAAIIGILLIMAFHFRNSDTYGNILMGFAILFTGLLNMTAAVEPLSESALFTRAFTELAKAPVIGFLVGTGVSFILQSSSAAVGILQALSVTGKLTFSSIYAVIIGIFLGDCVTTAIVCSIGAKADAKRTGIIHILYNLSQIIIVAAVVAILHRAGTLDRIWDSPLTSGGIANVNSLFKLSCAVLLLPVCGLFEKFSRFIVKDDTKLGTDIDAELEKLDSKFFDTPALALSSAHKAISTMADLSSQGVMNALDVLAKYNKKSIDTIVENEDSIDTLADAVNNYLIQLSPHLESGDGSDLLNYYMQCFSEFERVGDYAVNLTEEADELLSRKTQLSDKALYELSVLGSALREIMDYAEKTFSTRDPELARHIEPIEEVIDDMVARLRNNHTQRLRDGQCTVYAGLAFMNILTNIERVADQCSNVGVYTIALGDTKLMKTHHDYLRQLHQGSDPLFNTEYNRAHDEYFAKLDLNN